MISAELDLSITFNTDLIRGDLSIAAAQDILVSLDSALSLSVFILLENEEYQQVIEKVVRPIDYCDAPTFRKDYQAVKLLSKFPFPRPQRELQSRAIETYNKCELRCRSVNESIRGQTLSPRTQSILLIAQRKISSVLGNLRVEEVLAESNFGPRSDLDAKNPRTTAYDKLEKGSITAAACKYLRYLPSSVMVALGLSFWKGLPNDINIVPGNRVTFVPKNSKTYRTISVEPRWNVYFQKGVGRYIRRRLKLFGIDLDNQSRNQDLARWGSLKGTLATLDLESASDSLAMEVVATLLPVDWFCFLNDLRSKNGTYRGESFSYEKFSSMGNGFTFELESLIFYAVASAISGKDRTVSVYGDDIIVETEVVDDLKSVLAEIGFPINSSKTFTDTEFRESCGYDFFMGEFVTPVYLKERFGVSLEKTISFINKIFDISYRCIGGIFTSASIYRCAVGLSKDIAKPFRFYGPAGISSSFHSAPITWDSIPCGRGWCGVWVRALVPKGRGFEPRNYERAVAAYFHSPFNREIVRAGDVRYRARRVFYPSRDKRLCVMLG